MPDRGTSRGKGPEEGMAPPRFWQVPEAEQELAVLGPALRHLRAKVTRLREVQEELDRLSRLWGEEFGASDHPDAGRKHDLEVHVKNLDGEISSELAEWHGRGVEVKDFDTGLVDFYALRQGEIVFLCWRNGEEGIRFWHTLSGGYRSRRPLTPTERTGGLGSLSGLQTGARPPE